MRRSPFTITLVTIALLGSSNAAAAQFAVGVKAGTTGVGGEVAFTVTPRLALRASGTVMPINPEGTFSDIDFEVDLPDPLFTAGLDFHVLGGFRLMGGVLIGTEEASISGLHSGSVNIGGQTYSGSDLGRLLGRASFNNLAPYLGIGFGKTVGPGIGFSFDLGGAFLGEPELTLSADGNCTRSPQCRAQLQQDLAREEAAVQDDLSKYARIYPMVTLGVRVGLGSHSRRKL